MEAKILQFIQTLDGLHKKVQENAGTASGLSRLTINQLQYLDAVHALGNATVTDIAVRLNYSKASVSAGISKLIRAGYVEKFRSLSDRRVFHLQLTELGEKTMLAKQAAIAELIDIIRSALNEQETDQFERILVKIINKVAQLELSIPERIH